MKAKYAFAASLMFFATSAIADGHIVRWDRIEGMIGVDAALAVGVPVQVGPFSPSPRWRTMGAGRVVLNLDNGRISIQYSGFSWANQYNNAPLGSPVPQGGGPLKGTVVCNSTERYGPFESVDTPDFAADGGDAHFEGFVDLPAGCRDNPDELVFLIRHVGAGTYIAYGAARTIR